MAQQDTANNNIRGETDETILPKANSISLEQNGEVGTLEDTCDKNLSKEIINDANKGSQRSNTESDIAGTHNICNTEVQNDISSTHHICNTEGEVKTVPAKDKFPVKEEIMSDEEDDDVNSYGDKSGEWTDIEDNDEDLSQQPVFMRRRIPNPDLPSTVTSLETEWGSKVYLIGTAHFSKESQDDVSKVIQATQPDTVLVELCNSRVNILQLDEKTLLEEAKNINFRKVRTSIQQSGVVQGIMHLLLLSMSAHLTKELGMAPGGEFRRALQEAHRVPGCRFQLGDRPIQITLRRALASLSLWQKLRLGWYLLTSKEAISKEEVEKCKQKDLLEQMLKEMTGEFPALSRVFVDERDMFLAHSLKHAAEPLPYIKAETGYLPTVVVGVVGIGHVAGITANWKKEIHNMEEIMRIPPASVANKVFVWSVRLSFMGLFSYASYQMCRKIGILVF